MYILEKRFRDRRILERWKDARDTIVVCPTPLTRGRIRISYGTSFSVILHIKDGNPYGAGSFEVTNYEIDRDDCAARFVGFEPCTG